MLSKEWSNKFRMLRELLRVIKSPECYPGQSVELFDVSDSAVCYSVRAHYVDANQTESRVIMKNGSRSTRQKPQQAPLSIPEALTHQLDNIYITLQYTPRASNLLPLFALDQTRDQSVNPTLVAVVKSVFVACLHRKNFTMISLFTCKRMQSDCFATLSISLMRTTV